MSALAVECQDLRFAYGATRALDGVGFATAPGRILGLLGPNGSGKSTLLQILATLRRPDAGSAQLFGHDVVRDQPAARRSLGVVFQSRGLDPLLSVEENFACSGALYGLSGAALARAIDEAVSSFSLADRRHDRVKTLSGGLARRVELAKALLHRPRLLVLDEPSTGLDPRARREFWQLVRGRVTTTGLTVIVSTHLGEEAEHCDGLVLLAQGKIVAEGSPDALKKQIAEDTLRLKSKDAEALAAALRAQRSLIASVEGDEARVVHANAAGLLVDLVQSFGDQIVSATLQRPTLEDVFVKMTGTALAAEV
ncbi:MAG: ABC transporter ATP-binding protein [Deltaproteobacteria bacterium]|nr:ABC transporter ATP-binding protein [Deltaproteobacteria bacterium]